MRVRVCLYVRVYIYVCVCTYVSIYVSMCLRIYVMYARIYLRMSALCYVIRATLHVLCTSEELLLYLCEGAYSHLTMFTRVLMYAH